MSNKDTYIAMVDHMRIAADNDLINAINQLEWACNNITNGINVDDFAYKKSELQELRNNIYDKTFYIYDVLLPVATAQMEACDD